MRRRLVKLAATLAALTAFAAATAGWLAIRRADRFLDEASRSNPRGAAELTVEIAASTVLDGAPTPGVECITAVDDARDGAALGSRFYAATAGGLLASAPGHPARHPYTHLNGLAGIDLTAIATLGDRLVVGDASGGLTLVDGEHAESARVRLPRIGAVADLAPAGQVVYALFTGVGVIAFDGRRAVDAAHGTRPIEQAMRHATALCVGDAGLAVGTSDGALYVERGATLQRLEAGLDNQPITSLACDGEALLIGTPFGLQRVANSRARQLAADLFVTSVLPTPSALFVATFEDGVFVLDPDTGRERAHHLAGQSLHRLRLVDGKVVAFGPGGPFFFSAGVFAPAAAPPAGLAGPYITALARDGSGTLWAGTFEHGIDLLGADLVPTRHLPAPPSVADARDDQINALTFRPSTREMVVATVHGVALFGPNGSRRVALGDAASPDAIAALALTPTGLALAGSRGLTLLDGGRVRTLYAFHGLANNHVYAIAAVGDRIFAGTLGGLSIVEGGKVVRSIGTGPKGLRAAWVTALAAAPEGLYVGTYGGGVQLLRGDGAVEDVSIATGAFHVNPGALAVDGNTLWVGTLEAGLLAYDRTAHAWRRIERLLPSTNVTALLPDGDALLVGTTSGLVRITHTALDEALLPIRRPIPKPETST